MSIQKITRKSGTSYRARIRNHGGKQITKSFKRKIDAERWEREQVQQRDSPIDVLPDITFAELLAQWNHHHADTRLAKSTAKRYEQLMRLYILPTFSDQYIDEIRTSDVEHWFFAVQDNHKLSPKTLNHILNSLKTVMNFAVSRRLLHYNPCKPIKNLPLQNQGFDYWTREEVTQFLEGTKLDPNYGVYLAALNTGMRLGEIVCLKWDMVSLPQKMLTVGRTWCNVSGAIKNTTKGKRERHVPINQVLMDWLVANRKVRGLVFSSQEDVPDPDHFSQNYFRPACVRVGVRSIRFHDLRHTFASHFMMGGGDIFVLQRILGHKDLKTTQRYSHLSPDYLRGAAEIVSFDAPSNQSNVLSFSEYREESNK